MWSWIHKEFPIPCKTPATCSWLVLLNPLPNCEQQVEILVYYLSPFQGQYFLTAFWTQINENMTFLGSEPSPGFQPLCAPCLVPLWWCWLQNPLPSLSCPSGCDQKPLGSYFPLDLWFMAAQRKLLKYFADDQKGRLRTLLNFCQSFAGARIKPTNSRALG